MTVAELLQRGKELLREKNIDNHVSEARWIFEAVFNCGREYTVFHANDEANAAKASEYINKIEQRAAGTPVQYVSAHGIFTAKASLLARGSLFRDPKQSLLLIFRVTFLRIK